MGLIPVRWRDRAWIGFLTMTLLPMLLVDLVPYYAPRSGPLAALWFLRDFYVSTFNDPLLAADPPRWFRLFTLVEIGFQLPAVPWLLYGFCRPSSRGGRRRPGVNTELLALVFAVESCLSAAVCAYDVPGWDPEVYSPEQKNVFIWQMYGPYTVMPFIYVTLRLLIWLRAALMAIDMYSRLLGRLDSCSDETKRKSQ